MFQHINKLPTSLKVVVWLNLALAAFTAIETIAAIQSTPANSVLTAFLNVAVSVLVAIGIIQRSKLIRIIVLVFSWMWIGLLGLSFVAGLITVGVRAVAILIPICITGVTIWGLSSSDARLYFGIQKNGK